MTGHRRLLLPVTALLSVAGAVAVASVAVAGTSSAGTIVDLCLGVDHPPFEDTPPGGGNSYLVGGGVSSPPAPGLLLDLEVDGPQPPPPTQVETSADGTFVFVLPIQTHGDYMLTVSQDRRALTSSSLSVDADEVPCPDPGAAPASGPDDRLDGVDPLGALAATLAGLDVRVVPDPFELFFGGGPPFVDPPGDHVYSDPSRSPGAPSDTTDITAAGGSLLGLPPTGGGDMSAVELTCGPTAPGEVHPYPWDVVCPADLAGPPPPGDYVLAFLQFAAPVPAPSSSATGIDLSGLGEWAVVFESNGNPADDWAPQGPYAWDGFQGTDRWYVVSGGPMSGTWVLDVTDADTNATVDSDARAILVGDAVAFLVPTEELAAPTGWRGYAFNHDGSYLPEHSAMDVTGADPTEPLLPMPTTMFAADLLVDEPEPSPSPEVALPAPAEPSRTPVEVVEVDRAAAASPLWPLVALGGLVGVGGAALLRRRGEDGVVLVPPDPCAEELAWLDDARSRCKEARAEAAAARERLADAEAAADQARAALAEARVGLPGAGPRDRSSWVESGGRRIDSGDLAAGAEADAATWDAYRAGDITAEQAMQRWGRRGTPEEVQHLRDADARAEQAQQQVEAAEAARTAAATAVEAADRTASAACEAADAAAVRLERCRDEHAQPPATSPTSEDATTTAPSSTTAPPGPGTGIVTAPPTVPVVAAGDDPRDADEPRDGCCGSGTWIVYGRSTTSFGVVVGRELVSLTAVCVDAPQRWIEFEVLVIRYGLGAQVGGGGLGGMVWGATHPSDVFDIYVEQAGGAGFDLDLGGSWVKLAKSGAQLRKGGRLWDALKKLPGRSVPPPKLPPAELGAVRKAAAEAAKEFGESAGQGAAASAVGQGAKGSLGDLIVLPLGVGVGVAAHYGRVERSQVVAMSGCAQCRGRRRR